MRHASLFLCLLFVLSVGPALAQAVPQSREQITLSFSPVVKQAAPAVVNIYTKTRVQVRSNLSPFMDDPFFRQFFGDRFQGPARERVVSSLGSGVIVGADGAIVTSHHVVRDAQAIMVVLADGREFEGKVTKRDPDTDLAFLKIIPPSPLPHLDLRDSDTLEVGELVLAVGNPFGVGQTVTQGIISALARKATGVSDYAFFIQTDAAINPGNSGGALVDMQGRLIGVNTAIYSKTGGSLGIGFAIPANMVRALMQSQAGEGGRVLRPWLGISVQPMTAEMADSLGLTAPRGVMVRKVTAGSPAANAGIKSGDVIVALNGAAIASQQDLHYRIALTRLGDKGEFTVWRGGKEEAIAISLQAPPEIPKRDRRTLKGDHPLAGFAVANLSPALAVELNLDDMDAEGVVVTGGGGPGPLAAGDIILELNGVKVATTAQLEALLKKGGRSWSLVYLRDGQQVSLMIRK